jgi:uncharacterized protein
MKVILAGGTGFIGSALTPMLLDAGHSVTVLSRETSPVRRRVDARAALVEWNPPRSGAWEQVLDGADGVINLTGESVAARRWSEEQKQQLRSSRVETTQAIVQAIEKARVRPGVLVNASGVSYYGRRGSEGLDEDASPGRDFMAAVCQEREAAARAAEALGVRVALMRIGTGLGGGGALPARLVRPFRCFVGGPLGSGRQWVPWIHCDDIAGLFRFALEHDAVRGPVNTTAPEPVTMTEFCRTLGRVLHRPSWLSVPAPVLRLLLGEMAAMLLTGQRAEPRQALRLGYSFRFPTLEPALRSILCG